MKYIITNKEDNRIFRIGNRLDYQSNGYPRLIEENIAYPDFMVNVYEVESVPEEVEIEKYCYTEQKGFYINENYVEPVIEPTNAKLLEQVKTLTEKNASLDEQITELQIALVESEVN